MPLTALIKSAIPSQNFELIRDRIGAILLVEFTNQNANYGLPQNCTPATVDTERFLPFDESSFPGMVVRLTSSDEVQKDSSGTATYDNCFYIDIYTGSASTSGTEGDQLATLALHRMIGVIRAVLEDPQYDLLGFGNSEINIWNTHIENFFINLPKNTGDAIDYICGRVEFHVIAAEVPTGYIGTNPVEFIGTTVGLFNSNRGYYWKMLEQKINVSATSATLTNGFFSNTIRSIISGNATYAVGVDFTQSGTTITALTFEFMASTTITATT